MRWFDEAVVGFDTETTGVDVDTDRIVTAAVVRRSAAGTTTTRWLIDPGVAIPTAASAIHGVTTEHAQQHGRPPAEALEEIAATLSTALLRGEPLVAYNASFDLTLLDAELRRYGRPTISERIGQDLAGVIDPLVLDRHLDRYRPGKRRLVDLCAYYGVTTGTLHSADADVLATLDVLAEILRRHPEVADLELAAVHERQVLAHRAWAEGFNAWRAERGLTGPDAETCWPMRYSGVGALTPAAV